MLPHADWMAEDQRGAQARTSAGNNNDDDNQGDDMPSWMFKEESDRGKLRIETQRRNQPSARRIITMLHKMSKNAPWKESLLLDQF